MSKLCQAWRSKIKNKGLEWQAYQKSKSWPQSTLRSNCSPQNFNARGNRDFYKNRVVRKTSHYSRNRKFKALIGVEGWLEKKDSREIGTVGELGWSGNWDTTAKIQIGRIFCIFCVI
uniref:Uncharacterized protein n=1 Tax=Romanomermis culicivorax TaxID=13658 RepID=A0A915JYT6_ROMCU